MGYSQIHSYAVSGIEVIPVSVETHLSSGLPKFTLVGLPEAVVKESKERVRSALMHHQLPFPKQRITINLAPADLPKQGGAFDLPIAIGLLAAQGLFSDIDWSEYVFCGELGLAGQLRPIQGVLPMLMQACKQLILPASQPEYQVVQSKHTALVAEDLLAIISHLKGETTLPQHPTQTLTSNQNEPDFNSVVGQTLGKQAVTLAAVGGHALRFIGPPGCGKSLLAQLLSECLPHLNEHDYLMRASLYQAAHLPHPDNYRPSFRSPHHSVSRAGLIGGGNPIRPGEISLAHQGILFLDEIAEMPRKLLECLREPIEQQQVHLARASHIVTFPSAFQLICAMNPCPCGYLTDPNHPCDCSSQAIEQYQSRLSGPFLDRIALHVHLHPPHLSNDQPLSNAPLTLSTIQTLRTQQFERQGCLNNQLNTAHPILKQNTSSEAHTLLSNIYQTQHLSMRALGHLHTTAFTFADISDSPHINVQHIEQAWMFQSKAMHLKTYAPSI